MKVILYLKGGNTDVLYFREARNSNADVYKHAHIGESITLPSWGSNNDLGPKYKARIFDIDNEEESDTRSIYLSVPENEIREILKVDEEWEVFNPDSFEI
ncbi:MAG: hypothetical protein M3Q64_00910 [bacterium]|nr:hypothetical protein [bacterium]